MKIFILVIKKLSEGNLIIWAGSETAPDLWYYLLLLETRLTRQRGRRCEDALAAGSDKGTQRHDLHPGDTVGADKDGIRTRSRQGRATYANDRTYQLKTRLKPTKMATL